MISTMNPAHIDCLPGKLIVRIDEQLQEKKNGLYRPQSALDGFRKDTAWGTVISCGGPPAVVHSPRHGSDNPHAVQNKTGNVWNDEVMSMFEEGKILIFPRDVPRVFVFEGCRYAIIEMAEVLASIDSELTGHFEVVPWGAQEAW